ncbi:MAG: hypothetical protein KGN02_08235 [bacterium]|nr:hypothetical protein [bacterium]
MLNPIVILDTLPAASPQPHAIAIDGQRVWISSRASKRIDVMDRDAWHKIDELVPPGMPWGMTFGNGDIVMTCGEGDDDTRRIRRYTPGVGFVDGYLACPDDTGSHLAIDADGRVLLGQWYNKRLLSLRDDGSVAREIATPHGIAGVAVIGDNACVLGTDDEDDGEYYISRVDLRTGEAADLATVPFRARGLAWDGSRFWTNEREADRTMTFVLPS